MKELDIESAVSRRAHFLIVVLSGLLHLLLLFFLLTMHYTQQKKSAEQAHAQRDIDNALILAQSPQPHAAVIFQNPPLLPMPVPPQTAQPPAIQDLPENPPVLPLPTPLPPSAALEVPLAEAVDEQPVQPHPITTEHDYHSAPTKSTIPRGQRNDLKSQRSARKPGTRTTQQSVTLRDITKGFLKTMHQERGDMPPAHHHAEELSRDAYKTKIWTAIRQSSLFTNKSLHLFNDVRGMLNLVITLNKNGSLKDVHCEASFSNPDLDHVASLLQKIVRNVGLFPPIPRSFRTDATTFRFPIHAECHAGTHDYILSYGRR